MKPIYKFRIKTKSDSGKKTDFVWADSPSKARETWLKGIGRLAPETLPMAIDYAPITAHDLKYMLEIVRGAESRFFSRENMKFSGDTMRNYGVTSQPVTIETCYGQVKAWELYRRRAVKHGLSNSAYFDIETLGQVFPKR